MKILSSTIPLSALLTILFAIVIWSCKKENVTTTEPEQTIGVKYNPTVNLGWEGQTSFLVDSSFTLNLDLDNDGIADLKFMIKEGSEWTYNPSSQDSTFLPYQKLTVSPILGAQVVFSNNYFLQIGDTINNNTFAPLAQQTFSIAKVLPLYYQTYEDGKTNYIPLRLTRSNDDYYGWISLTVYGADGPPYWTERALISVNETALNKVAFQELIIQ